MSEIIGKLAMMFTDEPQLWRLLVLSWLVGFLPICAFWMGPPLVRRWWGSRSAALVIGLACPALAAATYWTALVQQEACDPLRGDETKCEIDSIVNPVFVGWHWLVFIFGALRVEMDRKARIQAA